MRLMAPRRVPMSAREVGAGDGLPGADEVEEDLAVDLPGRAAAGDADRFGMETFHASVPTRVRSDSNTARTPCVCLLGGQYAAYRASPVKAKFRPESALPVGRGTGLDTPRVSGYIVSRRDKVPRRHPVRRVLQRGVCCDQEDDVAASRCSPILHGAPAGARRQRAGHHRHDRRHHHRLERRRPARRHRHRPATSTPASTAPCPPTRSAPTGSSSCRSASYSVEVALAGLQDRHPQRHRPERQRHGEGRRRARGRRRLRDRSPSRARRPSSTPRRPTSRRPSRPSRSRACRSSTATSTRCSTSRPACSRTTTAWRPPRRPPATSASASPSSARSSTAAPTAAPGR